MATSARGIVGREMVTFSVAGGCHFSSSTESPPERVLFVELTSSPLFQQETMAKMEVKSSLLDNMIGVGDMVLLEPLNEETFIDNLKKRFDHNEIYVSAWRPSGF